MKKLNAWFNNYFGFNRQQRNGLWVLILISFTLLLVRIFYPYFMQPGKIVIQNLPLIERKTDSAYVAARSYPERENDTRPETAHLFEFDPNTVTAEQLVALGLRQKTAATFLKFRSRGFVFKEKKDLLKVYGISEQLYKTLEPFIKIENKSKQPLTPLPEAAAPPIQKQVAAPAAHAELNSADSAALVALNGIGPSYARRILKYRSLLGGYLRVEQLKEVYGFTEELYEKVKPFVTVNASLIKKLNLNKDDFKIINRHPYLGYELTRLIFDWRRKTTINPVNLKDILNDEGLYQKLLPYLEF